MTLSAAVVITTKNRKEELRVAIRSALTQSTTPQVLVIDDGSTDGTSELVRAEFPAVTLYRSETSLGLVEQRNRGAELASVDVIVSIDDDAAFSSPDVVRQTLDEFADARVGAVAIPFINMRQDRMVRQKAPDDGQVYVVPSYVGTAHALRRDLFLRLGGYRPYLIHQGEESDYCIRMLDAGSVVALGRADPIHHFESPRRDFRRMDLFGRRNDILFGWHNVPTRDLAMRWARATVGGLATGVRVGRPFRMAQGLLIGYGAVIKFAGKRRPVSPRIYRLYRTLVRRGAMTLDDVQALLAAS